MKFQKYYAVKSFFKNNTPSATCWPTGNLSAYCRLIGFLQANWFPAGQLVAQPTSRQACRPAAGQSACSKPIGLRQADRVASPPPGSLLLPLSLLLLISSVLRFLLSPTRKLSDLYSKISHFFADLPPWMHCR